jgi:Fic family protein
MISEGYGDNLLKPATVRKDGPMGGSEVTITWNGRPATAWLPDPLDRGALDLGVAVVRRTEQAMAAVRSADARIPSGWEPLARLLLRTEGVASSNIEGLHAAPADVAAAELDGDAVPIDAAWVADNLGAVTQALAAAATGRRLTLAALHGWHDRLMRHSGLDRSMVGRFRRAQGWIGGSSPRDAAYVPPPPGEVGRLMGDLLAFVNRTDLDPVAQAAVAHAQFEAIHPYGDGNGRIGRVLVLWVLARRLGVAVPPPVSVLIARDPGGYLSGLYRFGTGEVDPWVGWFADVVRRAGEAAVAWADEVAAVVAAWREQMGDVRSDSAARAVLDELPGHPVVSAAVVAERLGVSERAARSALATLGERGIVEPFAVRAARAGRPRQWWVARDLVDLTARWTG